MVVDFKVGWYDKNKLKGGNLMLYYNDMLEKVATLDYANERLERYAADEDAVAAAARKEALRQSRADYKDEKRDINSQYGAKNHAIGLGSAAVYAGKRGLEGFGSGRRFGVGGGVKTLTAGGIGHGVSHLLTNPDRKAELRGAKQRRNARDEVYLQ